MYHLDGNPSPSDHTLFKDLLKMTTSKWQSMVKKDPAPAQVQVEANPRPCTVPYYPVGPVPTPATPATTLDDSLEGHCVSPKRHGSNSPYWHLSDYSLPNLSLLHTPTTNTSFTPAAYHNLPSPIDLNIHR
ncbi:hypothetical protein BM1_04691 [Bipolaris maydis]|nr:hypothetical protein BM1_04691 [Bipolaris maydis]